MPLFDGTGPGGSGPRTGRGHGKCVGFVSSKLGKVLFSIAIPTVGAVIHDIRNPEGITRSLYSAVKSRITGNPVKRIENNLSKHEIAEDQKESASDLHGCE